MSIAEARSTVAGADPLNQAVNFGWKKGRDPSAGFDAKADLARNRDRAAFGIDPLRHDLENGGVQGRVDPAGDGVFARAQGYGIDV